MFNKRLKEELAESHERAIRYLSQMQMWRDKFFEADCEINHLKYELAAEKYFNSPEYKDNINKQNT